MSGRWALFERNEKPPPFRVQLRDRRIVREVFLHRYLRPVHVHLLLGGSSANLARRCRMLWQHRFLERPQAQRPLRLLSEELIYGVGPKGIDLVQGESLSLRGLSPHSESTRKLRGWPFIEHALGVAEFMVCLRVAAGSAGIELRWRGHVNRREGLIRVGGAQVLPDAEFSLYDPGREQEAQYYLEFDRGSVSLARMRQRYETYYQHWLAMEEPRRSFRVITVTLDEVHLGALKRVGRRVGPPGGKGWWGLWFADLSCIDVAQPSRILANVFHPPWTGEPRTLLR